LVARVKTWKVLNSKAKMDITKYIIHACPAGDTLIIWMGKATKYA
jgi:hypothetical protein